MEMHYIFVYFQKELIYFAKVMQEKQASSVTAALKKKLQPDMSNKYLFSFKFRIHVASMCKAP